MYQDDNQPATNPEQAVTAPQSAAPIPPTETSVGTDKKKKILWAALAVLIAVGLVAAGYCIGSQQKDSQTNQNVTSNVTDQENVEEEKTDTPAPEPTDAYAGWQEFSETQNFASSYAFDFKFPSTWAFDQTGKGSGCILTFRPTNNDNYWVCLQPQFKNGYTIQTMAAQELGDMTPISMTDTTIDGHDALLVEHPGGGLITAYINDIKTGVTESDQTGILIIYGSYRSGSDITYEAFKKDLTLLVESITAQ